MAEPGVFEDGGYCCEGVGSGGSGITICTIMEYGSTPYVGMARKKMATPYNAYKIIRSELSDYSHRHL